MKKLLFVFLLISPILSFCQKYPDHVITKGQEFIKCKITHVDSQFVYIKYLKDGMKQYVSIPMDSIQTIYQAGLGLTENNKNKIQPQAKTNIPVQINANQIDDSLKYLYNQIQNMKLIQSALIYNGNITGNYLKKAGVNSIISIGLMLVGTGVAALGTYINANQSPPYDSNYQTLYWAGAAVGLAGLAVGITVPINLIKANNQRKKIAF